MPTPTPHISAEPGDFAEAILLPGDPLRAKHIADNHLDDARQVTAVRKTGPRTVDVNLDGLEAGRVYQLNLPELKAPDGSKLHNRMFCYTANQLR